MRKKLCFSVGIVAATLICCSRPIKESKVTVIQRTGEYTQAARGKKTDPFLLVVEIDVDGNLYLNKVRRGTIDDPSILVDGLNSVFMDRGTHGHAGREVVIDTGTGISQHELENLVGFIDKTEAQPIVVIGNY